MKQEKLKKITVGLVFGWLAGIFVITMSMSSFIFGKPIFGIIIIMCGLVIIPYFSDLISDKFNVHVSGGMKFILVILVFVLNFSLIPSIAKSNLDNAAKTGGNVKENSTEGDGALIGTKDLASRVGCPNIIKEAMAYNIQYGQSDGGHTNLYLAPGFILEMQFSDEFELLNKPNVANEYMYASESMICKNGTKQGQSVNKLYCEPSYMYKPMLEHKNIDSDGNIVSTDLREIEYFIFDINGKDINNANDLLSLKLERMTCK